MQILKYLACITLGAMLGSFFMPFYNDNEKLESIGNEQIELKEINENECSISCKALDKLKVHEQKFFKNRDFIPKAILAYLAAIGVNMSSEKKETIEKILDNPKSYEKVIKELDISKGSVSAEVVQNKEELIIINNENISENQAENSQDSPNEKFNLLSNVELREITNRSALIQTYKTIKKMNGYFTGYLKHLSGKLKNKHRKIVLELNYERKGTKDIVGSHELDIEDYASKSGTGSNIDFRVDEKSGVVLVKVKDDSYFMFRSFDLFKRNNFQGLYFKNGKKIGKVFLTRKSQ